MIELGVEPVVHAMAVVAGDRKHAGHVVGSGRLLKVRCVA
jgi:hypothetical protein